jgi:hypothetical protein
LPRSGSAGNSVSRDRARPADHAVLPDNSRLAIATVACLAESVKIMPAGGERFLIIDLGICDELYSVVRLRE